MRKIITLIIILTSVAYVSCDDEEKSDDLTCRSGMMYFCKPWVENCEQERCEEEEYQAKNCRLRTIFICE